MGTSAKYMDLPGAWGPNGPVEAAGVLTFGCAIVGYAWVVISLSIIAVICANKC